MLYITSKRLDEMISHNIQFHRRIMTCNFSVMKHPAVCKIRVNNILAIGNVRSTNKSTYSHIGTKMIFISEGLTQNHIEKKLQGVFQVITASPQLSPDCAEYALPTICLSTFAICDKKTQKPKKICRDECEILENDVCQNELAIAKRHPLLGHQMVLPDCEELPPIGTRESEQCVKLGFPLANELIKPHTCYKGKGQEYRGTHSRTKSGFTCIPWSHQSQLKPVKHLELIGNKLKLSRK